MAKINAIVIIQWFDGKKVTQTLHCSHIHVNPDEMRTVGYFSAFLWAVQCAGSVLWTFELMLGDSSLYSLIILQFVLCFQVVELS